MKIKQHIIKTTFLLIISHSLNFALPTAVYTKSSSKCELDNPLGNIEVLISCIDKQIGLIGKYIKSNLNWTDINNKDNYWKKIEKKITKKCQKQNTDYLDPYNRVYYMDCIRDEYTQFNLKLINLTGKH